jgi:hypothetical protein
VSFVDGQNVKIEYRSAQGQYNRLPALAAELVRRLVVAMCLVLALACAAILFPDKAGDFLFWIKEWWGEQS